MPSSDDVKARIEAAFPHYECRVEIEEIRGLVSPKVFNDEYPNGFKPQSALLSDLLHSDLLDQYIDVCQSQVREAGFALS